MADTDEVLAVIKRKPGVSYPVLVPNMKGLEAAEGAVGVEEIAEATGALAALIQAHCRGTLSTTLLDRGRPEMELKSDGSDPSVRSD